MVETANALSTFLTASAIASLWIALLSAAIIQFFIPYITKWYQRQALITWSRRTNSIVRRTGGFGKPNWRRGLSWLFDLFPPRGKLEASIARTVSSTVDYGFEQLGEASRTPRFVFYNTRDNPLAGFRTIGSDDGQLMSRIRSEVKTSLSRPSHNMPLFLLATAGMRFEEEVIPLVAMEIVVTDHPQVAQRMGEAATLPPSDASEAEKNYVTAAMRIANLDDLAAQTAERNLVSLQYLLVSTAVWWTRLISLLTAGILTILAGLALGKQLNIAYLVIGVTGGVIAIMLRDFLKALTQRLAV